MLASQQAGRGHTTIVMLTEANLRLCKKTGGWPSYCRKDPEENEETCCRIGCMATERWRTSELQHHRRFLKHTASENYKKLQKMGLWVKWKRPHRAESLSEQKRKTFRCRKRKHGFYIFNTCLHSYCPSYRCNSITISITLDQYHLQLLAQTPLFLQFCHLTDIFHFHVFSHIFW